MTVSFEAVIGLEVHLHLKTRSKIFSACSGEYFGEGPNTFTDPLTLGLPGTLPTLNREAVEKAIMFGLALNCDVEGFTQFHPKITRFPSTTVPSPEKAGWRSTESASASPGHTLKTMPEN
jgi:aspartyl-tRNA(Asn)/glutamyl-tRNA(Gln) amidotransferase subunit B